ncbi:MAG: M20/M25/M40 family metallo-hydrolase [Ignavibacteriaceae bacterium]
MNIRFTVISFCIFLIVNVLAQNGPKYLVEISLSDDKKLNNLEDLKIPVLHFTDESLITLLTLPKLNKVEELNINYRILDEKKVNDKYFIVSSSNQTDFVSKIAGEQIVFKGERNAIVKNLNRSITDLVKKNINSVELKGMNLFKNERFILPQTDFQISDSTIAQIVSAVNPDSVRYIIQSLQDFETRFLFASTRDSVAGWIKAQFLRWGYTDVVIDSFEYSGTWQKNVVATLPGIYTPDKINIVGGHHDSYSSGNPLVFAPGADDNASGTSAVLEMARVLKEQNYQPESTIRFITFGAEEYGLWGSKDYALKAYNSGMDIKIMINHDMISHTYSPVASSTVDINYYSGFEYLRELAIYCTQTYSLLTPYYGSQNSAGSDSHSFWQLGFPSVYFEERDFSPFYHSPADTIGNYDMDYCAEVIKSSCATLLTHIAVPSPIRNYTLVDGGNGSSLLLSWSPNVEPDLDGYNIYLGTSTGVYDSTFSTVDTVYVLDGLTEGTTYYVGVSAYDHNGNESIIVERNATPLVLPLPPSGFTALPQWFQVELNWNANLEFDLIGYNIYRSEIEGELGDKQNSSIYTDTVYVDNNTINGVYYYYTVKAVDNQLNESENNTTLRSRVVSLDQGVLIVDETADGDGSPMNPTDEQVDDFYNELLSNFNSEEYDLIEEGSIGLADLGAYSSVIWHGNDTENMSAPFDYKQSIKEYLDLDGNFLYTGYRPSKAFEQVLGLQGSFGPGDFIYDYLKIDETRSTIFALFNGAIGIETGYSNLFVDSAKTLASNQFHLKTIENIEPSSAGTAIFKYGTMFDSTTTQGSLKGKPVGVEYIGTDYKAVTLSFPMYYMNLSGAKELTEYIMADKFEEVMPVEKDENVLPSEYSLSQNYPNPFNPSTRIKYSVPQKSNVVIKVFDLLGREVEILVNKEKPAGRYEIEFDASNHSSGIYFYKLQVGNFVKTKKMILLK